MSTQFESYKHFNQDKLNYLLYSSAKTGDLESVRYILASSDIKKRNDITVENFEIFEALKVAASNGHLPVVKFLLTSPDLKYHPNPSWNDSLILKNACIADEKEIVEYLLTSSDVFHKPNLYCQEDYIFKLALESNSIRVLEYLIFEFNMLKTINIERHLRERPNAQVEGWFKIRRLHKTLNKELPINDNEKRIKPKL